MATTKTASVSELRKQLPSYIESLEVDQSLMVLKHNSPVAYLLSPEFFDELLQTVEEVKDLQDMLVALEDFYKGDNFDDAEDVLSDLGL